MSMFCYETYIFDIDGTLLRGLEALPGAIEMLQFLREKEKKVLFATNTPLLTNRMIAEKLERAGIAASEREVVTPIQSVQNFLYNEECVGSILGLIASPVREELQKLGWDIYQTIEPDSSCTHVLLGMHDDLTYPDLTVGLQMIDKGAKLILLNSDLYYPTPAGRNPDTGALSAVFKSCTNAQPISVGKPSTWMQHAILKKCDRPVEDCLFIGDSPTSDIAIGRALRMDTILLKTGMTAYMNKQIEVNPTYEYSSLTDMLAVMQQGETSMLT